MGVIRVEHNRNYTTMANYHLQDRRLSLRAVGLMSKMLSLPEDWDYTVAGLATQCREGREAVRSVLKELEAAGYLVREQTRKGGSFAASNYTLYESPQTAGDGDESPPLPKFPGIGESPLPGNPVPEKPVTVFPPQQSTKEQSNVNKPPKPPRGLCGRKEKEACDYEPDLFERFWKLYPRGEAKAAARYEWDALRPDPTLMRVMSAALKRQMKTDEWQRGVGIPYACRWLSKHRWEDELKAPEEADDAEPELRLAGTRC